jgi:hypothetical protein
MKRTTPSLRSFQPAVVATLVIVIAWGLSVRPAQAVPVPYVVTLQQVGSKVVATGSGALDLTGLTFFGNGGAPANVTPKFGTIFTGLSTPFASFYRGVLSGPTSFGGGLATLANSGTGDFVGRTPGGTGMLCVPLGYVSGTALSDTSTYDLATFSTLGVTPGTYEWTWGTGPNQNFTLDIVAAGVPDSGSTFGLLLVALGGLFGVSRFKVYSLGLTR